jgi:hypothetical protein
VNDELERIRNEAVAANFTVLLRHSHERTEEDNETSQSE